MGILLLVLLCFGQIAASETGLSLIQRGPTVYVFSNACDFEISKKGRHMPHLGYFKIMYPFVMDFLITKIKCSKGILEL
jgi:hypothetical protein